MLQRIAIVVSAMLSTVALAQEHRGPPPEAAAACSGLSANAACGFTFRGKNHTGTCEAGPDGSALACRPSDLPKHEGHHGFRCPPPEAISACASASANATCSFTSRDGATLKGTCTAPPDSTTLACKPEGDHHHRGPPPEAFTACANASASQACSVTFGEHTMTGTCVSAPEGSRLVCRPDHPPAPPPPAAP